VPRIVLTVNGATVLTLRTAHRSITYRSLPESAMPRRTWNRALAPGPSVVPCELGFPASVTTCKVETSSLRTVMPTKVVLGSKLRSMK